MSERLIWHDEWSLGIEPLDADHRRAVELLDRLFDAGPTVAAAVCLHEFIEHLRRHFHSEQLFLRSIDYPEWQRHCRDHALQLAELVELKRELEQSHAARLNDEDVRAIRNWFFAHVIAEDRRFALYYQTRVKRP